MAFKGKIVRALVTGGAGFIGSALVLRLIAEGHHVLNIDKITYAGDIKNLEAIEAHPNYELRRDDISDAVAIKQAFKDFSPDTVFHLAAESHVDRSIDGPAEFIQTNITGTFVMLEAALAHSKNCPELKFLHVSTDEVYGSLGETGFFSETTMYAPNSPYAASKASADHLVRAWQKTYGLQSYISNCSNNYGPRQHGEKLIPTIIRNAILEQPIPIYGTGMNVRDWLFVDDHVDAMLKIIDAGVTGEKYNIGGDNEITNIEIAKTICSILDEVAPRSDGTPYSEQFSFVTDRPGHDFRYAIDPTKARTELVWSPSNSFEKGIRKTIAWYLENQDYANMKKSDHQRLGLKENK
jgi:dTDP-glucose 4,6-dehydratase